MAPALPAWPPYPGPGWPWALGVATQRASPAPVVDWPPAEPADDPPPADAAAPLAAGGPVAAVGEPRPRSGAAAAVGVRQERRTAAPGRRPCPTRPAPPPWCPARPRGAEAADGLAEGPRHRTSRNGRPRRSAGAARATDHPPPPARRPAPPARRRPGRQRRPSWAGS